MERITVVLADDNEDFRLCVRMNMDFGDRFKVVCEVGDGLAAIEACRAYQPDLILLDVGMPRMSGVDAVPGIHQVSPETKIVLLTAFSTLAIPQRSDGGVTIVDATIEKGANLPDLPATLAAFMAS